MTDTNEKKWRAREIPDFDHNVFYEKTSEINANGCIEWLGSITSDGYGTLSIRGDNYLAHRISMHIHIGDISTSRVIDHICRNRKCVNPEHLREATHKQNANENSMKADIRKRTHCYLGHEFTEENTYIEKRFGSNVCRICKTDREYKRRAVSNSEKLRIMEAEITALKIEREQFKMEGSHWFNECKKAHSEREDAFKAFTLDLADRYEKEIELLKAELKTEQDCVNEMIQSTPHYEDCDSDDPDDIENCNCGREIDLKLARSTVKNRRIVL